MPRREAGEGILKKERGRGGRGAHGREGRCQLCLLLHCWLLLKTLPPTERPEGALRSVVHFFSGRILPSNLSWASSQPHIQPSPHSHRASIWCCKLLRSASRTGKVGCCPGPAVLSSMAWSPPAHQCTHASPPLASNLSPSSLV